jgi:FkbM family methyltransferase
MGAVKEHVRRALTHKRVAPVVTRVLRATHTAHMLPEYVLDQMPVPAVVPIRLPDGEYMRMRCPGPAEGVASRLFWGGFAAFEPETTALFYRLSRSVTCVYDVGAYTGYYALLAARASSHSRIYSFEPVPATYQLLCENLRLNGADNVSPEPMALADAIGEANLYVPDTELAASASMLEGFRPATRTLRVAATTVDAHAASHEVPRVDLVKMDTEATEHQVLAGMHDTLGRDAPLIISEVLHGRNGPQQEAILAAHGYRWFHITDKQLVPTAHVEGDPEHRFRNYLFAHPRRQDLSALLPPEARKLLASS